MVQVVKGCGVDIIEIYRIAQALEKDRFKDKIFTKHEQKILQGKAAQSWAARFAAKEAVMKALGSGWQRGVSFKQIEIGKDQWAKPIVQLFDRAQEIANERGINEIHLSLSHNRTTAIAYAIAVGEE